MSEKVSGDTENTHAFFDKHSVVPEKNTQSRASAHIDGGDQTIVRPNQNVSINSTRRPQRSIVFNTVASVAVFILAFTVGAFLITPPDVIARAPFVQSALSLMTTSIVVSE